MTTSNAFLYSAGPFLNRLAISQSIVGDGEDANFPTENAYDGHMDAIVLADGTGWTHYFENNLIVNGGFEEGIDVGWEYTGVTLDSTNPDVGTYSAAITNSDDIHQYLELPPGMRFKIRFRADISASNAFTCEINNRDTLQGYDRTAQAWQSTVSDPAFEETSTGGAYATFELELETEPFSQTGRLLGRYVLKFSSIGGTAYLDEVTVEPAVNCFAALGLEYPGRNVKVSYSQDASTWTLLDTISNPPFRMLSSFARTYSRYWKAEIAGTGVGDATRLREAVWTDVTTMATALQDSFSIETLWPQLRNVSAAGRELVTLLTAAEQHELQLRWKFVEDDATLAMEEARDDLLLRAQYGQQPAFLIVKDVPLLGTLSGKMSRNYSNRPVIELSTEFRELPFGRVGL